MIEIFLILKRNTGTIFCRLIEKPLEAWQCTVEIYLLNCTECSTGTVFRLLDHVFLDNIAKCWIDLFTFDDLFEILIYLLFKENLW